MNSVGFLKDTRVEGNETDKAFTINDIKAMNEQIYKM